MAVYQVRLVNPAIALDTITVPDDEYILDIAGGWHPATSGVPPRTCSACVAKLVSGEVDQSEQSFCAQRARGWLYCYLCGLLCLIALQTHQEKVLYQSSLYFRRHHNLPTQLYPHPYHLWASSELQKTTPVWYPFRVMQQAGLVL